MNSNSGVAAMAFCAALNTGMGYTQDYPSKPIRIITSPAGGGGDFAARIVAQGISGPLAQQVIVDNRPSVLASEVAAKLPPDGYGLLAHGGSLLVFPLMNKASFHVTDFAPISQITREVSILAIHPSVPAKTVQELIALAKAKPGVLNYAMTPSGSANHLARELFVSMAGINTVGIPYKGTAASLTAVISGEVHFTFSDASAMAPHIKSGRLRPLAVTSAQPSPLAPGLPTIAASGLPGYEMVGQTSFYAPAKTPAAIITQLNREVVRHLNQPREKEHMLSSGVEAAPSSPEELAALVKSELVKAIKLLKDAGIKAE